jgi:hypothetical protein
MTGPGGTREETEMPNVTLSEFVAATAAKFRIPGVAVGVWADDREAYACQGVTSVDNPPERSSGVTKTTS